MKLATQREINDKKHIDVTTRAENACELARRLERMGEYEAACDSLIEFWPNRGTGPDLNGLESQTMATLLLRTGALAGWLGGVNQIGGGQETGKNLITKSIELFESLGKNRDVAEARADLALCYWREGAFDEARVNLTEALAALRQESTELKALILIRAGMVELAAGRASESMQFYEEAAQIVNESPEHHLKGTLHNSVAALLTGLAASEKKSEYRDRALIEYSAASFHFEQAGNRRYLASVENNLGYLFFTIGRYKEAHKHLDRARLLFMELKDIGTMAQVDDTRARTLLAEGKLKEAERFARVAVKTLEKGDECSLLVEALTTHGTVLARIGNHTRARALLQRAVDVAETCGDLEGAGRARLSMIEELYNQTSATDLSAIFHAAFDLLEKTQDPSARDRLISCGSKVIEALLGTVQKYESPQPTGSWQDFSLRREIKKIESRFIEQALRDAGGSVSKASRLLGFKHHQSLISLLGARHHELQDHRSIKRKRKRHLIAKGRREQRQSEQPGAGMTVLYVEGPRGISRVVEEVLRGAGIAVDAATSGNAAWEILRSPAQYDALVIDNNLPSVSGLELVLRTRSMAHRRNLPIIMFSADNCEKEAWRAGVDDFLPKSQVDQLAARLRRVIDKRRKG